MRGDERHVYNGDRTTADIVGFGRRVAGPLLPHVTSLPHLPYMPTATTGKEREESGIFVFGGEQQGELWVRHHAIELFDPLFSFSFRYCYL